MLGAKELKTHSQKQTEKPYVSPLLEAPFTYTFQTWHPFYFQHSMLATRVYTNKKSCVIIAKAWLLSSLNQYARFTRYNSLYTASIQR